MSFRSRHISENPKKRQSVSFTIRQFSVRGILITRRHGHNRRPAFIPHLISHHNNRWRGILVGHRLYFYVNIFTFYLPTMTAGCILELRGTFVPFCSIDVYICLVQKYNGYGRLTIHAAGPTYAIFSAPAFVYIALSGSRLNLFCPAAKFYEFYYGSSN